MPLLSLLRDLALAPALALTPALAPDPLMQIRFQGAAMISGGLAPKLFF